MTKLQIPSYTPVNAAAVAHAHLELNPEHRLIAFACPGCGQPIGILCAHLLGAGVRDHDTRLRAQR